jgi:SprT protein
MQTRLNQIEVRREIVAKVEEFRAIAAAKGYPVTFNLEFLYRGTKGGVYKSVEKIVAINLALACLSEANKDHILNDTVPHEVSHAICFQHGLITRTRLTVKHHDHNFYRIGRIVFGKNFERCHKMETAGVARHHARPYTYVCNCREHNVTALMHSKIVRGSARICTHCRTKISLKSNA